MSQNVLFFIEFREGEIRNVSYEAATVGNKLKSEFSGTLTGVVIGSEIPELSAGFGKYGVDKIVKVDNAVFGNYSTEGYAEAFKQVVSNENPGVVVFSATAMGRDLAPRAAAKLNVDLLADCTEFSVEDGVITAKRPILAGKTIMTVQSEYTPQIITIRPKIFKSGFAEEEKSPEVESFDFSTDSVSIRARVKEILRAGGKKLDLTEADIIVSGGRGMKNPENFTLLEEFAEAIGGVVGASRAAVDADWRPHSDQVGQTGKVVSPGLYIACGISGAIQHLAGMSSSKCVVAINKDSEAPIFKIADYGIVGDLFAVVPVLKEELLKILQK